MLTSCNARICRTTQLAKSMIRGKNKAFVIELDPADSATHAESGAQLSAGRY
jgi:hypothetical protein